MEQPLNDFASVLAIVNNARNANGWKKKTADELKDVAALWMEVFNHYKIPSVYLKNLYFRAFEARRAALESGKQPPEMNAELLVTNWLGANGLKAELDRLKIEEVNRANPNSRFLADDGKPKCHFCLGTGFREVSRFGSKGVIRCLHEENYTPDFGDEVVGVEEGIEIIKAHLARRGIAFEGRGKDLTNVIHVAFSKGNSA